MKTDTLFYQLFQKFPWIFFQLIDEPQTNIDVYQFIAPEIKQRSFRLDGLFTTTEEFNDFPLYFVEVQFYQEADFYDRLFPSIFLILVRVPWVIKNHQGRTATSVNINPSIPTGLQLSSLTVRVMMSPFPKDTGKLLIKDYDEFISTKYPIRNNPLLDWVY